MNSSIPKFNYILLLVLIFVLGSVSHGYGQATSESKGKASGRISGVVVDAETGETLIGVNVVIDGTSRGTATNVDGEYSIPVEPGSYTLKISYVSYSRKKVTNVDIEPGEVEKINVQLKPETVQSEEVTVTARALENTEAALLSSRQKSISFSNAISAEGMSSSGAGNAAEAMKKVVGASVVDGKYVHVRGLGDRYSGTQLNGSNLPSADPNKQSFQMDLFPSSLLKNITTIKTFTPDRPGNFSGGLVDVKTKDFPDQFTFEVSASTAYNTQSSFEQILQGNSSGTDFLGFDGGAREMPNQVQRYLNNPKLKMPERTNSMEDAEELDRLTNSFNQQMAPSSTEVGMNQSYSISVGDLLKVGGNDFGYTASLTYGKSYSSYPNGQVARWAGAASGDSLFSRLNLSDRKGEETVDLGGLVNLSYRLNSNNKLSATYLRTQSGNSMARYMEGRNTKDFSEKALFQSQTLHYTERSLGSYQLKGKHYLPDLFNATVRWNASYANNTQEEPDLRYVMTVRSYLPAFDEYKYQIDNSNAQYPPSRYFRDLDEDNVTLATDISVPFKTHTSSKGKFKFGGTFNEVDRAFRESRIEYKTPRGDGTLSINDVNGDVNEFFNPRNVGVVENEGSPQYGLTIENASTPRNNYDATKELLALYGMVELPVVDRLKFSGGVRMEDADIKTVSHDSTTAVGNLDNTDFLPSANLTYNITDRMNARASYTKTLARPTFRELAPYVTFQFRGDYLFKGNTELKRTLVTNYDLRWEWFPNPGELFAVSGFYKEFNNPLEHVLRIDIGNNASSIQNVDKGRVYGAEFEIRKRLDFIDEFLRHFIVSTNFTVVESEVDIPRLELIEILGLNSSQMSEEKIDEAIATAPESEKKRPLEGQSPYTFNLDISYDNPGMGLSAAVNYHIFGDRLKTVMAGPTPDTYERAYGSLDFVASQSISRNFSINMSIDNILNPYMENSQEFKGAHYINQSYRKGVSYKFGIKYKL